MHGGRAGAPTPLAWTQEEHGKSSQQTITQTASGSAAFSSRSENAAMHSVGCRSPDEGTASAPRSARRPAPCAWCARSFRHPERSTTRSCRARVGPRSRWRSRSAADLPQHARPAQGPCSFRCLHFDHRREQAIRARLRPQCERAVRSPSPRARRLGARRAPGHDHPGQRGAERRADYCLHNSGTHMPLVREKKV